MSGGDLDKERIIRYYKGSNSEQDLPYIQEVFNDNANEKELKGLLSEQFDDLSSETVDEIKGLDQILYKIHYDINTRITKGRSSKFSGFLKWYLRVAGIVILPLALFFGVRAYLQNSYAKETWVEIKAPAWTRAQFSLPDGTTGWLNSNSSVKYNGTFNDDRQVTLHGEAFFDVFKDKNKPFIVNADEINVKVLGTKFNIACYENEENIEVVLEEGKLAFNDKEMNHPIIMNPDDMVIYDKVHKDLQTDIVEPQKYLSWTEGKLVFRNDPLDVIIRRLERWYNIDVEVHGKLDEDLRLRATFIGEDLEQVLDLLRRSLPIEYEIVNSELKPDDSYSKKKVIISPRTR